MLPFMLQETHAPLWYSLGMLTRGHKWILSEHCLKSVSLKNTLIVSVRKLFSSNPHSHFPEQEENVGQNQEWELSQADPSS